MNSNSSVAEAQPTTSRGHSLESLRNLPSSRKFIVLGILCSALFLDTFNNSSLFAAIPPIALQLNIPDSQSVWLLGAYQLTFAALLLISGRLSDLYNPKWVFIIGASGMGVFALISGFIRHKIPLILLRALMGAGGALTIPSAQHLIVHMFPVPQEQAKAITIFGAMGAIGIVLGLVIGALFVTFTSWPWVFYFSSIVSATIVLSIAFLVPNVHRPASNASRTSKLKRLDLVGVAIMTQRYWRFVFPGFLLGTAGAALIYTTANIALLTNTPTEISGIVSAVFVCALQTGGATGLAIVTSIQTSVQIHHGGPTAFAGRAAGLWFLVAILGTTMVLFVIFMKDTIGPIDPSKPIGVVN
ncbi:hypothetical protein M422DRAFT_236214 [Sphaerobolus stellatus SS14]|uniref:Major facilitator superfamily (MFS) profile domain-containing protein n=1 Tax=Sphaerobolus stellatus (strain SS14) TaxID=990650 RepID=A0A0C9UP68_SPHS4|nr:hypothetical protein M422DRAFT_236214 [Sphaerobolus stellatus SS14]